MVLVTSPLDYSKRWISKNNLQVRIIVIDLQSSRKVQFHLNTIFPLDNLKYSPTSN